VDEKRLIEKMLALASPHRFRILSTLAAEPLHVSELARRLAMSRALLYMHLQRLEAEGFITGRLELTKDGKALKFFDVVPFELKLDVPTIVAAVEQSQKSEN